jgi:polar amino acid transport system substrate-binding protein
MAIRFAAALVLGLVFAGAAAAQEPRAKLTSLEWPPYSGAALPGGGLTVAVLRTALK